MSEMDLTKVRTLQVIQGTDEYEEKTNVEGVDLCVEKTENSFYSSSTSVSTCTDAFKNETKESLTESFSSLMETEIFQVKSDANLKRSTETIQSVNWHDGSTKIIEGSSIDKITNLSVELEKNSSSKIHSELDNPSELKKAKIYAADSTVSKKRPDYKSNETSEDDSIIKCQERVFHDSWHTRSFSVAEVKEHAYGRLQEELKKAQEELKLKDEKVARLSQIRDEVGAELEELTASLFEEAHNMIREANMKQATSLKLLKEANLKNDVLQEEVQALKTLVTTSNPNTPNHHIHSHLGSRNDGVKSFLCSGHKRSPSNYELASQKESPSCSSVKENPQLGYSHETLEVDPTCHEEFVNWRKQPELLKTHPFLVRVYEEDVLPCLQFANEQLAKEVLKAIEDNSVVIEDVSGKNPFPKKCCLLQAPRFCKYRMKLGEATHWYYISQLCRNRIAAVCEFFCYLRYIQQGLVKSSIREAYSEVMRRRLVMAMSRLGLFAP